MLQFIRAAAIAAPLFLAPAAELGAVRDAPPPPAPAPAVAPPAPEFGLPARHEHAHGSGLAPGQTPADFSAWLARSAARRAELSAFRARLAAEGVEGVVPLWQLVRTSSSWRQCGAQPFEVAPADKWDNIVKTLKFVRDEVVPVIGPVEALSAYRNERLNACSAGAPRSAHRLFFALDLAPVRAEVSRAGMVRRICAAHARDGRAYDAGLGFYSGRRFHVDSNGYRKWGPNGRGASSPCVTGIA
jgi:hypothetical protein